jgi:uncharacterized DUF497 family protein
VVTTLIKEVLTKSVWYDRSTAQNHKIMMTDSKPQSDSKIDFIFQLNISFKFASNIIKMVLSENFSHEDIHIKKIMSRGFSFSKAKKIHDCNLANDLKKSNKEKRLIQVGSFNSVVASTNMEEVKTTRSSSTSSYGTADPKAYDEDFTTTLLVDYQFSPVNNYIANDNNRSSTGTDLLVALQKAKYGICMYDILTKENEKDVQKLMKQGSSFDEAAVILFEKFTSALQCVSDDCNSPDYYYAHSSELSDSLKRMSSRSDQMDMHRLSSNSRSEYDGTKRLSSNSDRTTPSLLSSPPRPTSSPRPTPERIASLERPRAASNAISRTSSQGRMTSTPSPQPAVAVSSRPVSLSRRNPFMQGRTVFVESSPTREIPLHTPRIN